MFVYLVDLLLKPTNTANLQNSNCEIFRKKKVGKKNGIFERRVELLCAGMKAV
jgi:hypothetical protein